jgi:hypothetical protein
MAKSKTGIEISMPEPTSWARAVMLGTGILGVALVDRSLTAKNLDELGRKILDIVHSVAPAAQKLVAVLEVRAAEVGFDLDADRARTARSALALCNSIATGKTPREVVEALAVARLETSSSAVQASLASAVECIETLEDPLVLGVLKQLAGREKYDLSASKYMREARAIMKADEMRRSLSVELRMVAGAAQAYLLSGAPSGAEAGGKDDTVPKSMVMASVVAPAAVRIESTRPAAPPPPSATRPKTDRSKRSALAQTLTSEGVASITRVSVERRGTVPNKDAARALLAEAVKEAEAQLDAANGMVLLSFVVTLDVHDKGT